MVAIHVDGRADMRSIPEVSDVDLAFPARGVEFAPPLSEIPELFRAGGTKGHRFFSDWFGGRVDWTRVGMLPKEGVDPAAAFRVLQVVAGTWSIKHQHKESAVAYLLHEWFEDFRWATRDGVQNRFDPELLDREWLSLRGYEDHA